MLHDTCILVRLAISLPPQTKTAKEASQDVEMKYKTAKKQGKVTKVLFSQKDIKPLTQAMNKARTIFNENSLPYDAAYRIIPSARYFDFVKIMSQLSEEFDTCKKKFLNEYHIIQMRSAAVLGDLFDEDDYPSAGQLDHSISFSIESSVIPKITAFDELAGLTPEAVEDLKSQALAGQQKKIDDALQDLYRRLFTSLNKASSKLADEDSIFRDTLVSNIHDALQAVDCLNITNNPDLMELANKVRSVVGDITPQALRDDKELRKETAKNTKEVMQKISEFF